MHIGSCISLRGAHYVASDRLRNYWLFQLLLQFEVSYFSYFFLQDSLDLVDYLFRLHIKYVQVVKASRRGGRELRRGRSRCLRA